MPFDAHPHHINKTLFTHSPVVFPVEVEVTHEETSDRNYFYATCPFCGTVNDITYNPETEVQFQTCKHCEKQFINDWSKVR